MRKPFDRQLFNDNDTLAKNKVKELLGGKLKIVDNPKRYGVDLLVFNDADEHIFNIETEIKRVWVGDFPYQTVQFPERKKKFCSLEKPTYFIMFNSDLSQYLVVKSDDMLDSPLGIVPNKYVRYGEQFYQIPLAKVAFNKFSV